MASSNLEKAKLLLRKRKFSSVVKLLEPLLFDYRESFQYFYTLGLACLYLGDVGGAETYFKKARQIKINDVNLILAQACLFLRKGYVDRALEYCLDALELESDNRYALRFLSRIRKKGDKERMIEWAHDGRIKVFYPPLGLHPSIIPFIITILLLLTAGTIIFANSKSILGLNGNRADISDLNLTYDDRSDLLEKDLSSSVYTYILTKSQVEQSFSKAQTEFQRFNDNAAQLEINRILNSNAAVSVKQKARELMTYLAEPSFDSIKNSFSYTDVSKEPVLYTDCWVLWSGRVSNITVTDTITRCSLLIGYEDMKNIEGIVPLQLPSSILIDPEKPVSVLAKIIFPDGKLALQGKSVYQSVK
jgi:tetratricopeptide (TPR) repeat protein